MWSVPPRKALLAALIVLVPVLLAAAAFAWWLGLVAAVWVVLGVVAGAPAAMAALGWSTRLGGLVVLAVAGVLGLLAADEPWLVVLALALAGLVQHPWNRVSVGLVALAPLLVAVGATSGFPTQPAVAALCLVVGGVTVSFCARGLGVAKALEPVGAVSALVHAVAVAVGCATAFAVAQSLDLAHGYWMVLVIVVVLQPVGNGTRQRASDRVVGTLIGLLLAAVIVLFLPGALAWALMVPCLLFTLAWSIAGQARHAVVFGVPLIVLLSSSDLVARADVALERLALTVGGAVVALALAWASERAVERLTRPAIDLTP